MLPMVVRVRADQQKQQTYWVTRSGAPCILWNKVITQKQQSPGLRICFLLFCSFALCSFALRSFALCSFALVALVALLLFALSLKEQQEQITIVDLNKKNEKSDCSFKKIERVICSFLSKNEQFAQPKSKFPTLIEPKAKSHPIQSLPI